MTSSVGDPGGALRHVGAVLAHGESAGPGLPVLVAFVGLAGLALLGGVVAAGTLALPRKDGRAVALAIAAGVARAGAWPAALTALGAVLLAGLAATVPGLPDGAVAAAAARLSVRGCAVATIGGLVTAAVLLPEASWRPEGSGSGRGALGWTVGGGAGWLVGSAVQARAEWALEQADRSRDGFGAVPLGEFLFAEPAGRPLVAQFVVVAVLVAVVGAARGRAGAVAALPLAVVCLIPLALGGGAAGMPFRLQVMLVLHVVSASVYVGGFAGLAGLGLRASAERGGPSSRAEALAAYWTFSAFALGAVVCLLVSGLAMGLEPLRSTGDLRSGFAVLLAVKVGALVLLLIAGAMHRRWSAEFLRGKAEGKDAGGRKDGWVEWLPGDTFVRLAVAESAVMAVALTVASVMVYAPPPGAAG